MAFVGRVLTGAALLVAACGGESLVGDLSVQVQDGELDRPEALRTWAFVQPEGSRFDDGATVYAELTRNGGQQGVLELHVPSASHQELYAHYSEWQGSEQVFNGLARTGQAGWSRRLDRGICGCIGGYFALRFDDPGPDEEYDTADDAVRILDASQFELANSRCGGDLSVAQSEPLTLSWHWLDSCSQLAGLPVSPRHRSSDGGVTPVAVITPVTSSGCQDDSYTYSSSGSAGCELDSTGSSGSSGCEGDTTSASDGPGCEGDTSSSSSSGCEEDSTDAPGCEEDRLGHRPLYGPCEQNATSFALVLFLPGWARRRAKKPGG